MTHLTLQAVTKQFGAARAVDSVDLTVPDGKLVCFLGPSGCGKTTLLRMIAGLEMPSAGSITFAGNDITRVPANQRDFGMVFQSLALFPHMTVAENIAYPLKLRKTGKTEQTRRVAELLDLIQLPHMAARPVTQLSGGQRQRVAIARAIASSPKLLLLDEPLSALDAKLREAMQVEIRLLQQRLGITTIMVTHDQREAMTMADLIVVMEKGRIAQVGKPLDIYRDPVSEFVADFIGLGNILPVTFDGRGGASLPGGTQITVASPARGLDARGDLRLLIRPEDVHVRTANDAVPQTPRANCLPGTVTFIRDVGASLEATIDCAGFTLTAATTPRETPGLELGMPVMAELPAHACKLIAARTAVH
ncbi:ABC transporter ATP-binding protein [Paraburkholderia sabiae]|jgi:putative spermidine/putrescine transport system ATP-binding protein|uniref:ABC transporter ATP-binding protein n=1 Tax=Paraburkholderia sabiae TaxID=273251 RepID=A0ABU9QCL2_9BURK|nr:ABC transporter ATP-binding protein [Paraburkholderia sabiae]WJZ75989.1 ABC transporter ATP-binding protein [Paraburkholderia sabiae]CAD6527688.1 Spermidine/putrescine import ATP-binding protein PotA [Paraburkholderia sabiae]